MFANRAGCDEVLRIVRALGASESRETVRSAGGRGKKNVYAHTTSIRLILFARRLQSAAPSPEAAPRRQGRFGGT